MYTLQLKKKQRNGNMNSSETNFQPVFLCSNMPGGPGGCFDSHIPRALKTKLQCSMSISQNHMDL